MPRGGSELMLRAALLFAIVFLAAVMLLGAALAAAGLWLGPYELAIVAVLCATALTARARRRRRRYQTER